nr:ElyC/SanA/YdcF family protein [Pararhizobium mangrovi]
MSAGLAGIVVAGVVLAGFLRFAEHVAEMKTPTPAPSADAIVVLTGGPRRIESALRLLRDGAAHRLLISGVNPKTTGEEIRKLTKSSRDLFSCCVDIGHDAIDTIGNANETARWIHDNGYRHVVLVTNDYHMPRSLMELHRVDTSTDYIPYPVVNTDLTSREWLTKPNVVRRLVAEYLKYSAARVRSYFGGPSDTGLRTDRVQTKALKTVDSSGS